MGGHAGACSAITLADSVLDSSPGRYSHVYLTRGCVRYLFRMPAKETDYASGASLRFARDAEDINNLPATMFTGQRMACPRTCQTSQFHIIQLSTITYGFFGFRAVFLLS